MNRIDDANSGYIYSLYVRVLSYGERLRPAVSIRSAAMRLLSLRGVAMRLLGRQPLLLTSEPPEAASSQKQADVAPEPPVLPETPRVLQEAAEASRPAMSKVFWCCTPGLEGAVFSLFALDLKPMSSFIESAMVSSTKDISYFVTDTAAYIVSKMWDDLLAGVLFRMNTIFLCSPEHHRPCNRPADAGVQLKYCVVVVVVCAFIKTHVERHYAKQNRGTLVIPGMLGMLVGWTFGRAFQQLRQGLEAHVLGCAQWGRPQHVHGSDFNFMYILTGVAPETEAAPTPDDMECEMLAASGHTTLFRMLFAFLITLLSSLLILLLEPAAALETFGSSAMRRRVGVRIKSVVQLFCKAAATTSMILWNDALTGGATKDILNEQSSVRIRMLLFYSMAMTFGGSAVSLRFQSWSRHLTAPAEDAARAAAEEADKKRQVKEQAEKIEKVLSRLGRPAPHGLRSRGVSGSSLGGSGSGSSSELLEPSVPLGPSRAGSRERFARMMQYGGNSAAFVTNVMRARSLKATRSLSRLASNIAALRVRIHFIAASLRTLAVLEATLGWVAGCAWTEFTVAVNPTIGAFPDTWWVVFANVRVALLLSVLAIAWITFTGNSTGQGDERESRELLFIGGAFSFFSGWAWIAVVRCLWVMPYALMPAHIHHPGTTGDVDLRHLCQMLISLVFSPVATWLVIRAALATKNAYEKRAGIGTWRRHINAIRAFTRARAEMNRRQRAVSSRLPEVLL